MGDSRIPRQLVLTSKRGSIEELPAAVQKNVKKTLGLSSGFRLRLLGDAECQAYIRQYYGESVTLIFEKEKRGSFRGDICRAAVLAQEGGFYLDLDVELKVSLESLFDKDTTFVSAFTQDSALLNAVLATEPQSPIMRRVIEEISDWYGGKVSHTDPETSTGWLGPVTLLRALRSVAQAECPGSPLHEGVLQWACGKQLLRLYEEHPLNCQGNETEDCPKLRAQSDFEGLRFGIFTPESVGMQRRLVAWPRFSECSNWGCGAGGWDESSAATELTLLPIAAVLKAGDAMRAG